MKKPQLLDEYHSKFYITILLFDSKYNCIRTFHYASLVTNKTFH